MESTMPWTDITRDDYAREAVRYGPIWLTRKQVEGLQPPKRFATFTLRVRRCGFAPRMELALATESIGCRNKEGGAFAALCFLCQRSTSRGLSGEHD
jgi:hypothetical protein